MFLKDFFYNSVTSLVVEKCDTIKLHLDCPNLRNSGNLQSIEIRDCSVLEIMHSDACTSWQAPTNVVLKNIKYIPTISSRLFRNPSTDIEKKCIGNKNNLASILINNVTIGLMDYNSFENCDGISTLVINNTLIETIKENAINGEFSESGKFILMNSILKSIRPYAFNIKSDYVLIHNNRINELPSNVFNFTATKVVISENEIDCVKTEALGINTNEVQIIKNRFKLLKTGALINISPMDASTPFIYNFTQNEIHNLEVGSLYFNSTSLPKILSENVYMGNNVINCQCNRLAWLTDFPYMGDVYNFAARLNSHILDSKFNNTCMFSPCKLPLDIVKVLLNNNMCQFFIAPRPLCYLYQDPMINNMSTTEMRNAYSIQTDNNSYDSSEMSDEVSINGTEPAPAFYIIKPEYFTKNYSSKPNNNKNNSSSENSTYSVDEYSVDLIEYLRSYNVPNVTVDKMLTASRKNLNQNDVGSKNNSSINSKCHDKESCSKYIQENKKKALDYYKSFYEQFLKPKIL